MRSLAVLEASVGAALPPPFAQVDESVALIGGEEVASLSTDELRKRYAWLTVLTRTAQAIGAHCLAELDRREQTAPDIDPGMNASCWLRSTFRLTDSTAYSLLRTARQLDKLPRTHRAFREGDLGADHVSVICRAMDEVRKTSLDASLVEGVLVRAGRDEDSCELRRRWAQMRYQADQDAGVEAEREQHERRWARFWRTQWDTLRFEGELDPESGAVVSTALRAIMGRRKARGDERTANQRRADAMVQAFKTTLDVGDLPTQGGQKPHLTLVATLSTLRLEPGSPLAKLDWGSLVTGHAARRLSEDADVTPVLVSESGDVLQVGRRARMLTTRQRKALNLRDQHCQAPGCEVPAELCTPHHYDHWASGGSSDLPNTGLYCDVHHPQLHPENARYRRPVPCAREPDG